MFVAFQATFAAITCCLIVGAFAERMKFSAVLIFMAIWFTFSYVPIAHMVWFWPGPDAYTATAEVDAVNATAGYIWQWARSTSPAALWCTSTRASPAWSAPT